MLEVSLKSHIFHLDVTLPKRFSKDEFISRYVDVDLATVMEFIKDTNPINARLFVQTPHQEGMLYVLNEVSSVWSCLDSTGQKVFICIGNDHETVIANNHFLEPFSEITRVWPRTSHATWPEMKARSEQRSCRVRRGATRIDRPINSPTT